MKPSSIILVVQLCALALSASVSYAEFEIPDTLSEEQAARFRPFESFHINGVCGEGDYERLRSFGVNTIRGYTIPSAEEMRAKLDELHSLGMKLIVSEWMPNQGENKGNDVTFY